MKDVPPREKLTDLEAPADKRDAIATRYGITPRTVDRCNRVGALPDVAVPPPWGAPLALAEWYRLHYRSDVSRPSRGAPRAAVPAWLQSAVARAQAGNWAVSGAMPDHSTPSPSPPPDPDHLPRLPAGLPAASPPSAFSFSGKSAAPAPLALDFDPIEQAEAMLVRVKQRYDLVQHDPIEAPPAQRAYFETFEKLQQAKAREQKLGDADSRNRALVEEVVDRVHTQIPARLAADLSQLRREIQLASTNAETFPDWCSQFFRAAGQRMVAAAFGLAPITAPAA